MKDSLHFLRLMILGAFLLRPSEAVSNESRINILGTIGVIPVQWIGLETNTHAINKAKAFTERAWAEIPREAQRFRVVNQEVVSELWSSPTGRQNLVRDYEIDAFMALSGKIQADVVVFSCRLLSPDLERTFLYEAETLPLVWLFNAMDETIHDRLQNLAFRMLNRLPVDVSVTSVQGAYMTLSAGLQQNLKVGETLTFYRTRVAATHPVNGAWLRFNKSKVARARVVATQNTTSVAQILSLPFEGAVKIGDGARIPDTPSRLKFKRMLQKPDFKSANAGSPILYPAQKKFKKKKNIVDEELPEVTPPPQEGENMANIGDSLAQKVSKGSESGDQEDDQEEDQEQKEDVEHETPLSYEGSSRRRNGRGTFDYMVFDAGPRLWNASGSQGVSASASLPLWLFNNFRFQGGSYVGESLGWEVTGGLEFGSTGKGSYSGFSGGGRFFLVNDMGASFISYGLGLSYQSIGVSSERFGGLDMLKLTPYVHYQDKVMLEDLGKISWFVEVDFTPEAMPLNSGKVGTRGAKRDVSAYSAWHLYLGAIVDEKPGDIELGGQAMFGSESFTMNDQSLSISDFYLAGIMRIRY